ncbi:MAG: ABC transporter ATP-binding protein, partial [Desulfobacterales bacterium]
MLKSIAPVQSYFKENLPRIAIGLASLIIVDMLQLFIPRIIKWTVDGLTALQIDLRQLLIYAIYMAIIAVLIGLFRYVWRR